MDSRYSCVDRRFHGAAQILGERERGIHERLSVAVSRLEGALVGGPLPAPDLEHRRAAIAVWFLGRPLSHAIDAISHDEAAELADEIVALANEIRAAHEGRR